MTTTGWVRTAHQPRSTGFELVDDEEASRHRFLTYTFPSCSPGTARPVVPNRPDFVAAAPTLPGIPRVRLPPASPSRYDDQAMQVSHLHPKQQRLVAHDVLVDARGPPPRPGGPGRPAAGSPRPRPRPSRCASRPRGGGPAPRRWCRRTVNASVAHAAARVVSFARGGTRSCCSVNTLEDRPVRGTATAGPATPAGPGSRSRVRPRRLVDGVRGRPRRPRTPGSRRRQRRTRRSAPPGPAGGRRSGRACPARRTRGRCEGTRARSRRT